ncbi:hypothetical protein Taro_049086, partial [Colocasia esculenta]|nr:hypothetical protein [Colocasia esculenta]
HALANRQQSDRRLLPPTNFWPRVFASVPAAAPPARLLPAQPSRTVRGRHCRPVRSPPRRQDHAVFIVIGRWKAQGRVVGKADSAGIASPATLRPSCSRHLRPHPQGDFPASPSDSYACCKEEVIGGGAWLFPRLKRRGGLELAAAAFDSGRAASCGSVEGARGRLIHSLLCACHLFLSDFINLEAVGI